jgi:hypothetical protein
MFYWENLASNRSLHQHELSSSPRVARVTVAQRAEHEAQHNETTPSAAWVMSLHFHLKLSLCSCTTQWRHMHLRLQHENEASDQLASHTGWSTTTAINRRLWLRAGLDVVVRRKALPLPGIDSRSSSPQLSLLWSRYLTYLGLPYYHYTTTTTTTTCWNGFSNIGWMDKAMNTGARIRCGTECGPSCSAWICHFTCQPSYRKSVPAEASQGVQIQSLSNTTCKCLSYGTFSQKCRVSPQRPMSFWFWT